MYRYCVGFMCAVLLGLYASHGCVSQVSVQESHEGAEPTSGQEQHDDPSRREQSSAEPQPRPDKDGANADEPAPKESPGPKETTVEAPPYEPSPPQQKVTLVTLERLATVNELRAQPLVVERDGKLSAGLPLLFPLDKYTYQNKQITTVDQNALYIVRFDGDAGPYSIERIEFFGLQAKQQHQLKQRRPTALFARQGQLYVGGIEDKQTRVDTIDFNQTPPLYTARYTARLSFRQEVDEFAILGNKLIAIDDVIVPKYGFVFALDDMGRYIRHMFTNNLPVTIDGAYAEGTARGDQLYLREQFNNLHGHGKGQGLLRLQVTTSDFREKASLAEYVPTDPQPGSQIQLLAGDAFTTFQGMELLGDKLLIGAGERGVIVVPSHFTGDAKATQFNTGGTCTDLTNVAGEVFALVQTQDKSELLWLIWEPASKQIAVLRRFTLKGRPTRFPK